MGFRGDLEGILRRVDVDRIDGDWRGDRLSLQ